MKADPDADRQLPSCEGRVDVLGRTERAAGGREHGEESVALNVDLGPAVLRERAAHETPVRLERLRIRFISEFGEKLCRARDIRPEERDGADRQLASPRRASVRRSAGNKCRILNEDPPLELL